MFKLLITWLERLLFGAASLALLVSVGLAFYAVVLRYGFNASLEWIEEAARYFALFSALLVAGPVLRHRGHVALDMLPNSLRGRRKYLHRLATGLIAFSVATCIFLWGTALVSQSWSFSMRTGSLQFPQWLPYSIFPAGMGMLMVFSLIEIIEAAMALRRGDPLSDEQTE